MGPLTREVPWPRPTRWIYGRACCGIPTPVCRLHARGCSACRQASRGSRGARRASWIPLFVAKGRPNRRRLDYRGGERDAER